MLIWFRFTNIFSKESLSILDVWQLKDGDYATLTNRWEDIPSWFELHPTEALNTNSYKMMMKLEDGYKPKQIMDGPNIWRINAGDTIVWLGKTRSDMKSEDGILNTIKFNSNALLLGESTNVEGIEGAFMFGSLSQKSNDEIEKMRSIVEKLRGEGIPRIYSTEWGLG